MRIRELKRQARACILMPRRPNLFLFSMLYVLLLAALMLLVANLSAPGRFLSEMMSRSVAVMNTIRQGGSPILELPAFTVSFFGFFFFIVPWIFQWVLALGYLIYARGTIQGETMSYRNLFDGFNFFFKAIIIQFVRVALLLVGFLFLFPGLWLFPDAPQSILASTGGVLFLLLGLRAFSAFSQANLLLLDNPERGGFWCLSQSRRLMRGHKVEYLLLFASFLGWELLATVPFISYAVRLWYLPYSTFTYVNYYNHLTGQTPQEPEWKRPGMF